MVSPNSQVSVKEKIGYGFGDFASSMFWKLFSVYLMIFYTDVFGISAAAVGTMFVVTRLWDSVNDPIMGIIADRTETKWGKFRPYLMWGAIPFALIGILTFTTPDISQSNKLIYAYVTYTMMMMAYTAVNVPYASLLGVMSSNSSDRTALASYRMVFAFAGSIFAFILIEPLLDIFSNMGGEENAKVGWTLTIAVYGVIAAVLFYMTFAWTKERIAPPKNQEDNLGEDAKSLLKNVPWFVLLGAALCTLVFNSLRDGAAVFYFKYTFENQDIALFGMSLSLITTYLVAGQVANIVGVMLAQPISDRIGKRSTFICAMLLATVLSGLFYFLDESQLLNIIILQCCISACAGIIFPLMWSMYADIADFAEHSSGRRATGLIFSSSSFAQKMGWTFGGAVTGWLLAFYGYEANQLQSEETKQGLRLMVSVFPAIGAAMSAGFMLQYKLTENVMDEVHAELAERRK
ncbi:MFS transporter [Saccharophagus degradans]|uniref:Sugar (Glycoside-Pentoside-Hexuronide) transporter n=1 Tax=Saccharophagus degradans (strain 2-40 / ATCC 43961 / DSM 17024) TaxID=203122 RepID=Q21ID5_SACD2|nr:MFS transporter [Saccharophagus degradans]ABD81544.1 sugar (Glycoside-Pentoside-Hexuronide) transporter [Saccharophagus degradans 2-40]